MDENDVLSTTDKLTTSSPPPVCRACMGQAKDLRPLFLDKKESRMPLPDIFLYVTGLLVNENDGLPSHICTECISMVESALQFKEMCYRSDMNFRKGISGNNGTTIKTIIKKECDIFSQPDVDFIGNVLVNKNENVAMHIDEKESDKLETQAFYQCALCGHSFQICNKLKEHVKTHHINNVSKETKSKYSCSVCSKVFRTKKGQESHLKRCQIKEDKKVKEEAPSDSDSDTPLAEKFETRNNSATPDYQNVEKYANNCLKDIPSNDVNTHQSQDEDSVSFYEVEVDVDYSNVKEESSNDMSTRQTSDSEEKHSCEDCNLTLSKTLYDAHMKTVHPVEKKTTKRKTRKSAAMNGDISSGGIDIDMPLSVTPAPTFKCTQCERRFLKMTSLQAHLKKHEKQMNEVHKCETCKREFKRRAHLENHMLTHSVDKGFKCTLCPKAFSRQDGLLMHVANHKGNKKHQCNFCEKGFNMLSTLKDHIRTHTGEKPFLCSICGRGFSQSTNLKEHVRRHQGYKPFKCDFCSQTFVSKGELEAHLRKHSGAHPFVCDECGGGFTTSSSLVKHKRIHTGERPYQCDFCTMRFTALGTLKNHRRTHTGEKPYKCQYCDKAFAQKNDLVSHTRTHTGERPYVCSVCGHAFRQSSALKTHFKIHGGQDSVPAEAGGLKTNDQLTTTTIKLGSLGVASIKIGESIEVTAMKIGEQIDMVNRSPMDENSSSLNLMTPKSENSHQ